MKSLVVLSLMALFVHFSPTQASEVSIQWPDGKELKVEQGQVIYVGDRHRVYRHKANICHRHILATAQREVLDTKKRCPASKDGQKFTLTTLGRKQRVQVCTSLVPRYQRTLEGLIRCHSPQN